MFGDYDIRDSAARRLGDQRGTVVPINGKATRSKEQEADDAEMELRIDRRALGKDAIENPEFRARVVTVGRMYLEAAEELRSSPHAEEREKEPRPVLKSLALFRNFGLMPKTDEEQGLLGRIDESANRLEIEIDQRRRGTRLELERRT